MKIVTILGARPQFIKAAAVSRIISDRNDFQEVIIHTGQHYDENMSDIFFEEMKIPIPKYKLSIGGKSHGVMTGLMMRDIEKCILNEKPDGILVYGDTNSTLAGSLVGSKLNLPIFHVEAGLRSFNMRMPEEINRIITDRLSTILFCPTKAAVKNLINEGYKNIKSARIEHVGDVMQDAVDYYTMINTSKILENLNLRANEYVLATIHRAENTDEIKRLKEIFKALNEIAKQKRIILPLHPRTKSKMEEIELSDKIKVIEPVGYFDMISLTQNCSLVITDSGGLQKEAYFASKHCITVRDETEWIELVEGGFNKCVGSDKNLILQAFKNFQKKSFIKTRDYYGAGKASQKIVQHISSFFNLPI